MIRVDWAEKRKAYQHDVTFPPAGIRPRRANLPTVNAWLSARLARKRLAFVRKLETRWSEAFCAGPKFGPEEGHAALMEAANVRPRRWRRWRRCSGRDAGPAIDDLLRKADGAGAGREAEPDKKAAEPDEPAIEEVTPGNTESI